MEKSTLPQIENPKPPEIKIPTYDHVTRKMSELSLHAIPDSSVHNPDTVSLRVHKDDFEKAYNAIVGNISLQRLFLEAFLRKKKDKYDVMGYAQIENTFSQHCISLSDAEIDNLIRNFRNAVLKNIRENKCKDYNLNQEDIHKLTASQTEKGSLFSESFGPEGIKSVVRFVRNRLKMHAVNPVTIPAFYFENYLDARHKIDLIEIIKDDKNVIMNLIQIKSRDFTEEEIQKNTNAHRDWVNEYAMDLSVYEKTLQNEPVDSQKLKELFEEAFHLEDVLTDILTGDKPISKDLLFDKLGLKGRPNIEVLWVLSTYMEVFKDACSHVEDMGLTDDQINRIRGVITDIQAQVDVLLKKKKDLEGISEVHSVFVVHERQVSDVIIFKGEGDKRKALNIKK